MDENFAQAALRHWRDAELLREQQRVENADQLYGLAAECALKVALLATPNCSSGGKLHKTYKEHIDDLWDKMPVQSFAKRFPGLLPVLRLANPYRDWSIKQRYLADGIIRAESLENHRQFTKRLLGAVQLSGVLGT